MSDKTKAQEQEEEVTTPVPGIAKLRIVSTTKEYLQAHNSDMLDVTVEIYNAEAAEDGSDLILDTRRLTFPLTMPSDEIKAELAKVLSTFNADALARVNNAEHEAAQKQADETMEELSDLVIDPEEENGNNDKEDK